MRTTVSVADELLESAKLRARERGQTLGELVEDALRRELSLNEKPGPAVPVPAFDGGTGTLPGVDLSSNRAIAELLDEGLPFEKMR